jgi:hypothetical protein
MTSGRPTFEIGLVVGCHLGGLLFSRRDGLHD